MTESLLNRLEYTNTLFIRTEKRPQDLKVRKIDKFATKLKKDINSRKCIYYFNLLSKSAGNTKEQWSIIIA